MIEQKQIVKKPKNNLVKIIIKHIIIVQDILYHNILVKKEKLKVIIYGKKLEILLLKLVKQTKNIIKLSINEKTQLMNNIEKYKVNLHWEIKYYLMMLLEKELLNT